MQMIHMLDLATEKAGWGKPLGPNRGRGISCFFSKTTYLAQVAEVTVKDGNIASTASSPPSIPAG